MIENVYRSPTDQWFGGVAAGLAQRFGLPTSLVRLLFVIGGCLFNVIAVLVYLVLWLVLPEGPVVEVEEDVSEEEEPVSS